MAYLIHVVIAWAFSAQGLLAGQPNHAISGQMSRSEPFVFLQCKFSGAAISVPVKGPDGKSVWMLFDSGAAESCFKAQDGAQDMAPRIYKFPAGGNSVQVTALSEPLLDVKAAKFMGILGVDGMHGGQFVIDYRNSRFAARYKNKEPFKTGLKRALDQLNVQSDPRRLVVLPIHQDQDGWFRVSGSVQTRRLELVVDTGSRLCSVPLGSSDKPICKLPTMKPFGPVQVEIELRRYQFADGRSALIPSINSTEPDEPGIFSPSWFATDWTYLDFINNKIAFEMPDEASMAAKTISALVGDFDTKIVAGRLFIGVPNPETKQTSWIQLDEIAGVRWKYLLSLFTPRGNGPPHLAKIEEIIRRWSKLAKITLRFNKERKSISFHNTMVAMGQIEKLPNRTTKVTPGYKWVWFPVAGWCEVPDSWPVLSTKPPAKNPPRP